MHKLKKYILLVFCWLFIAAAADARPGRNGISIVQQPDGSSFSLITMGDEFYRLCKTSDGCAVVKDLDGWWCYAVADENGSCTSTGWHVGQKTPADVIASSRNIPQISKQISERIQKARALHLEAVPLMKRIQEIQGTKAQGAKTHKHGIVLLAQFSDVHFKYTKNDFVAMLTQKGYSKLGATGCAKEYFESQFGDSFVFDFDVSDIVTLSQNRAYYGGNVNGADRAPEEMVIEACKLAAGNGIDFSIYDQNSDGQVDNVFVIFAGDDEADYPSDLLHSECIWSHAWFILDGAGKNLSLNGKVINRYACSSELRRTKKGGVLTGIGTFCHEYSHTMGLPDYYDTDYERSHGMSASLWGWTSLMDSGNLNNNGNTPPYFNAVDREILGLSQPKTISINGTYELNSIGQKGEYYKIETDHKDEYYLIEHRCGTEGWDRYIRGNGIIIYHVDKSDRTTGTSDVYNKELTAIERWNLNEVNAYPLHQCVDLIEADGRNDNFSTFDAYAQSATDIASLFFNNEKQTFSATSSPAMIFWSGEKPSVKISQFHDNGKNGSFFVSGFGGQVVKPEIEKLTIFQDAAIINFSCRDTAHEFDAKISYHEPGGEKVQKTIKPYAPGKYSITLYQLDCGKVYDLSISLIIDGVSGVETKASFITGRHKEGDENYPYISLKSVDRNPDGSFPPGCKLPLKVWNIPNQDIQWLFNNKPVTTGSDGYFTPETSGTLKAIQSEKHGNNVLVKVITIKKTY